MSVLPSMPQSELRLFEKAAVPLLEAVNRRPGITKAIHATLGKLNGKAILVGLRHLLQPHNLAVLDAISAPNGLILVSNHRSFMDMFVISSYVTFRTKLMTSLFFPVRHNFFYTNPLGVLVNFAASGGTMWPPVFRDERRRVLNPVGFQQMAAALGPGVVVGLHPEGKRSKDPDPYTFLPLKPGLGLLLKEVSADVRVLPCFITGLSSDIAAEFGRNRKPAGQRGAPIRIHFGQALVAGELRKQTQDAAALTELVFAQVRQLAEQDRQLPAQVL